MLVVPVVDLRRGRVVHARRGERSQYAPIVSTLTASTRPVQVVAALLRLHPFHTLYVADLDAIEGRGDHCAVIDDIARRHPRLELWVDAGLASAEDWERWPLRGRARLVLGSESQRDMSLYDRLRTDGATPAPVVSLDFRQGSYIGPPALFTEAMDAETELLVMHLDRVGAGLGPDYALLDRILSGARRARVYAAGGVRGPHDLARLRGMGVHGALVATAMHRGDLGGADLSAD